MDMLRITTCLALPETMRGGIAFGERVATIGALLRLLGEGIDTDLTDGRGGLIKDLEVVINGKDLCFLPDGLDTRLKPEDEIEIYFVPLGGG